MAQTFLPILKRPPPRQTPAPIRRVQQKDAIEKSKEEHEKRGFRALLNALPEVVGKDPRFPTVESTQKFIVERYKERLGEMKPFAEIWRWARIM